MLWVNTIFFFTVISHRPPLPPCSCCLLTANSGIDRINHVLRALLRLVCWHPRVKFFLRSIHHVRMTISRCLREEFDFALRRNQIGEVAVFVQLLALCVVVVV